MPAALLWALCVAAPGAASPALGGGMGLLNVPSAAVAPEGAGYAQYSKLYPDLARTRETEVWYAGVGFAPGLELGGRAIASALRAGRRDLSLDAKYRLPFDWGGWRFAVGALDLGGVERLLPREYGVASWSLGRVDLSLGYGRGRNVLEGPFGGAEWRPWRYVGLVAEHDGEDVNGGIKLRVPLAERWRISATGAWRGALEEAEYSVQVELPLGRTFGYEDAGRHSHADAAVARNVGRGLPTYETLAPEGAPTSALRSVPATVAAEGRSYGGDATGAGAATTARCHFGESRGPVSSCHPEERSDGGPGLVADTLHALGFESVRTGRRGAALVVQLENRRYNHSAADGLGLALGAIAARAPEDVASIELYLLAYGVPQLRMTVPAARHREFLANPERTGPALRREMRIESVSRVPDDVAWHNEPEPLQALELVLEPLLRTFVATEYGLLDYAVGARARLTAPLGHGLLVQLGAQAPLAESDDMGDSGPFAYTGYEGGLDLALAQFLHSPAPGWTLLWSAGRAQVYRVDADTVALDQAWAPGDGRHRLRAKLVAMRSDNDRNEVALAGYTWLDARRAYSIALTAGRFYAGDFGGRIDVERYFGDTIVGLFYKGASSDDQAAGVGISLPLTPRRDAMPRGLQVKGPRRWMHSLASTLNAPPSATSPLGTNPIRPLMLYEPVLDFDLERDIQDAGRLSAEHLREQLPRMHEAYRMWGAE